MLSNNLYKDVLLIKITRTLIKVQQIKISQLVMSYYNGQIITVAQA